MNDWRMYTDTEGEANHLAWHEVLMAIARLDGTSRTLVHAAYGDHVDLVVAGGNGGDVLVQWKEYGPVHEHWVLTAREVNGLMKTLTVEGSEVAFPKAWCVPLERAVPICGDLLRTLERGEYDDLVWVMVEQEAEESRS